jgi:L-alanine-DL-glutamate epimerase-like enolase superfamily enzyme
MARLVCHLPTLPNSESTPEGEVPWRAALVTPTEAIQDGQIALPTGPGLGVSLAEAMVAAQSVPR